MIANKPALLAARWAQVFSATSPSITLAASEIRRIDDRRSMQGSLFTDGCSPISLELAYAVWSKMRLQKKNTARTRLIPSAFQIRIAGAKVLISVEC